MSDGLKLNRKARVTVGTAMMVAIAAIHAFRIGSYLSGPLYTLYYSYASDLMLPFVAYFMLSMNEERVRLLRNWYAKALVAFAVMAFSEMMQLFGVYFFGVTFDVIDILMYGIGALSAAFCDKQILGRVIPFWRYCPGNG